MRKGLAVVVVLTAALLAAACGSSNSESGSSNPGSTSGGKSSNVTVALISDIGKFNDRSFNQSQKEGLDRAKSELGVQTQPLQSNSTSDYVPNLSTAVRKKSSLIIAAGFLLADATNTVAKKNPKLRFAITDYDVKGAPFNGLKNVEGLTYAANESGCLVGYLAAEMAKKQGGRQVIGAVGGLKIPPVDIWIAGYRFCAKKAVPGMKVLIGYSQSFTESDKCKTVATNQISAGAKVLFQVAGGCGLGVLKAAAEKNVWAIGVDADQAYLDPQHVLTSARKNVDVAVFKAIQSVVNGTFKGGNVVYGLKDNGVSLGKINARVPKSEIAKLEQVRKDIVAGKIQIPTTVQ
jgi:basic membrane protein A